MNPKFGFFSVVNTFRKCLVVLASVQFCVLAFVLWYVLKMTGMQTKGRVKGNVLIFSFYFIFSLPKALLESRTLFPITECKVNYFEVFCCTECYFQYFPGKLLQVRCVVNK